MIKICPLTIDLWEDFEQLFGSRGACEGCWCMFWKLSGKEFYANRYENNRLAMKNIVSSGIVPGLLAYVDGVPAGWCAVEPRAHYSRLARSRSFAAIDSAPVWSITCFFVEKKYRKKGLSVALLKEAIDYVDRQGGRILEGYPKEIHPGERKSDASVYIGLVSTFLKIGFKEVGRNLPSRPIMRLALHKEN